MVDQKHRKLYPLTVWSMMYCTSFFKCGMCKWEVGSFDKGCSLTVYKSSKWLKNSGLNTRFCVTLFWAQLQFLFLKSKMLHCPILGIFINLWRIVINLETQPQNCLCKFIIVPYLWYIWHKFTCCSGDLPWTTAVLLIHTSLKSCYERTQREFP